MAVNSSCDVAIVGAGIVGCATALALVRAHPGIAVTLFEKEHRPALHQTGHNSGVIHAGLYYRPGSLKAATCSAGREALYAFCAEHAIPHQRCGKLVVAVDERELPALDELERRGRANGLAGLTRLNADEVRGIEPWVRGLAGLFVPQTGIVDFVRVTEKLVELVRREGGLLHCNARIDAVQPAADGLVLCSGAERFTARVLVNCAGLHADRVARLCGVDPGVQIIPFRGEYYRLRAARSDLVKYLVYPVPDPALPFLGVHFTRRIDGSVEAGPNAVLAFKREGYRRTDLSPADLWETLSYPGFRRLARRYWQVGLQEYGRSLCKWGFVRALQRLVPVLHPADLDAGGSGVRAQAVDRDGRLLDDFHIVHSGRMVHVLNAPSPAATAALSIGRQIAAEVAPLLDHA